MNPDVLPEGFGDDEISRAMKEAAELPAKVAQLAHALELEQAGREQDRQELKMALDALWDIAEASSKSYWNNADWAHTRAEKALKDIGAAVQIKPGVYCARENVSKVQKQTQDRDTATE